MFNPCIASASYTGTSSTTVVEVDAACENIRLYPVSGSTGKVFFNSTNNAPGIVLVEGLTIPNVDGQIKHLHLVFDSTAATINVLQLKNISFLPIRS